jgi:thioredoxin reductase (NADPH)
VVKIYDVAVIGGGAAGVMATIRTILNNDECILFPGTPLDKKRSRAFWVSAVENMPAHLGFKKGIEGPNKISLDW